MVATATFIRDILYFLKNDLTSNITDPLSGKRSANSKFVMTSYPQREVEYPIITIKLMNRQATRAGMQTTAMDVILQIEIRIWALNQKHKDELANDVYERLRAIQFTAGGSIAEFLDDFQLLSDVELEEEGELGVKSRILQIQYKFFNVS